MTKVAELTIAQRSRIKALRDVGWTLRRIAADIKCSPNTVKYTLDREKETGNFETKKRNGRPRKLSDKTVKYLRLASLRDRKKTARELRDECNKLLPKIEQVSRSTVSRRLCENGLYGRVAVRKPLLREVNVRKRLEFAKQHKDWTVDQWMKVLWTDESKFELFGSKRRQYVRRRSNERYHSKCIVPTMKHGGGNILVWGCFSGQGVGDLKKIDGKMDKKMYHQILIRHGVPSGIRLMGQGFVYQQDNDPKHTSNLCKNYLTKKEEEGRLRNMNWPPQSPDLNPIEHLWDILDKKIDKSNVTSQDTLWEQIQAAWQGIPLDTLKKLVMSMPDRMKAVIKAKGYHTKY